MDSLFRGLNRQLLPNSHIFSLAAVESTVVSILPGAPFFKRELFCGGAQTKEGWFKPTVLTAGQLSFSTFLFFWPACEKFFSYGRAGRLLTFTRCPTSSGKRTHLLEPPIKEEGN